MIISIKLVTLTEGVRLHLPPVGGGERLSEREREETEENLDNKCPGKSCGSAIHGVVATKRSLHESTERCYVGRTLLSFKWN